MEVNDGPHLLAMSRGASQYTVMVPIHAHIVLAILS